MVKAVYEKIKSLPVILGVLLIAVINISNTALAEEIKGIEIEYTFLGKSIEFDYNDDWFESPSTEYSPKLAVTSLGLAMSTYSKSGMEESELSDGVEGMLSDMHFENLYHNDYYNEKTDGNGCAVAFGMKELGDTTLVAVAVRGGRYGREWAGNFNIGRNEQEHAGFAEARDIAAEELGKYLKKYVKSGKIKFWVTGFSRGAAIANLLSADLTKKYSKKNVYSYCFETPANNISTSPAEGYENIFNILDPNDLVPKIPPAVWSFTRYGRNVFIPEKGVSPDYDKYFEQYLEEYEKLVGGYGGELTEADMQFEVINRCLTVLADIMRSRKNYNLLYQDIITGLIEDGAGGINYVKLLVTLKQAYDELLVNESGEFDTEKIKKGFDYLSAHSMELLSALVNHTPIVVLCWMKALEDTDVMKNCIDSNGLNTDGHLSAVYLRIYGEAKIAITEEGKEADGIVNYKDETGASVYMLPWNKKLTLELTSEQETELYICMSSYRLDSALCNRATEYKLQIDKDAPAKAIIASGIGADFSIELVKEPVRYVCRQIGDDELKSYLPYDMREELPWPELETETETEAEVTVTSEAETTAESEIETETETVTETDEAIETAGDSSILPIIIAVALTVIILIFLLIIIKKKKIEKNMKPNP